MPPAAVSGRIADGDSPARGVTHECEVFQPERIDHRPDIIGQPVIMVPVYRFVRMAEPSPVDPDAAVTLGGKHIQLVFKLPVAERPAVQKHDVLFSPGVEILHVQVYTRFHTDKITHANPSASFRRLK